MKDLFRKSLLATLMTATLSASQYVVAAQTVCNDNGGAGWIINDGGITNLVVPFNFGDISRAHDVDVSVDITHTWVGDLTMSVSSPESGTTVPLFERPGTAALDTAPVDSGPYGCSGNNIVVNFNDEAASGTNIEGICAGATPTISGEFLADAATGSELATYDGEDPTGDWSLYLSDSANQDTGTLNQVCVTAAFSAVTFDKWVSSNASCSDTIDSIAVAPGTDVYFCYSVENPSSETFTIGGGDWSDDQGHDLSGLQGTYVQNDIVSIVDGPYVAGSASLPVGTTTNNASVTGNFSTPNFTGTLTTPESATAIVADPVFNTSTKTVVDLNGGSANPGDVLEYTVTINETAGIFTPNVQITDVVDASLGSINITTLPAGATDNTVGNNLDVTGITVPANGSVTLVFEATIGGAVAAGTSIDNTATISHAASAVSFDAIAATVVVSAPNISTSTKVEFDVNGTPSVAGDVIRYTITINETGGNPATNITLTDTVDANLTSVAVISIPAGASDGSAGNSISITNISVPASGSASVVIEGTISGVAPIGTNINNTASIIDIPSGESVSPSAGTIIVSSPAATGIKQLYTANLNTGTPDLTRSVPGGNTNTANFGGGSSVTMDMTPVFQLPFTITGGSTINVNLNLRRRNGNGARTADIELFNGNTGTSIGTDTWTWNAGGTQYHNYTITPASDVNFAAGDFIRLVVTNNSANNRNIQVRSLVNSNQSQVSMDSSTVINVDSINVYAAAYPSTTQYSSYAPGSTVFIRATVSDPFGNADISGANVTITDPNPTVLVNGAAMTSVATPTGGTREFEYQYTIPATPDGYWDVSITANEGTEGTVSHTTSSIMIVGTANIVVAKTSTVLSDPINVTNPKAIPNAIVEYTITVTNTGFGYSDTDTISISDPIDTTRTTLVIGTPPDPATFTQGATSSGLTYNFINLASGVDDIAFSADGCSSFVTPTADAMGFDNSPSPIDCIEFNPKGELRGSDGINNPSFTIQFQLRVD